jgi:hypothetical protein
MLKKCFVDTLGRIVVLFVIGLCFLSNIQAQIPSYVPSDGLVGWWPFNGNANDESVNDNHGTATNGAALTTDRFGASNKAYSFDGANDYIALSGGLLEGSSAVTNVTFAVWFLADGNAVAADWQILGLSSVDAQILVGNSPEYFLHAMTKDLVGGDPTFITPGTWHHLVVTYATGVWKAYRDGVFIAGTTDTPTSLSYAYATVSGVAPYVWFGAYRKGNLTPGKVFDGKLDDIAIWTRTLSETEVAGLYQELVVTSHPSSSTVAGGHQSSMSVAAEGRSALSYQWQRNDGSGFANITDGAEYSGSTSTTLTIKSAKRSKAGPYRCVVSASGASVNSNSATITVTCPCNTP